MSKYIENNLGRDETIVLKAKKSLLYLLMPTIWLVIVLVVAILATSFLIGFETDSEGAIIMASMLYAIWVLALLIGIIPFLKRLFKYLSINLALTNKRLVGKVGLLKIRTLDVPIDKLDSVAVSAGIFGNLFHYYSLTVVSVGGSSTGTGARAKGDKMFVGISNAQQFKNAVTEAIEQHAAEARKQQAEEIARAMGR